MAEINITPLVDVMLVLLVIFMVTAPLLDHRMDLTLPQRTPPPPQPPAIVLLEVAPGDVFRLAGQAVAPAQLQALLEGQRRDQPGFVLKLAVHPDADYQSATTALAAANRAGVHNISLD
ncbi:ExbD/TolR family protein [Arenimonas soli]|nr:biopolymer transporter ExbD [Arenimonas soli]